MKLGILGTGHVAKTLSAAWSQTHEIRLGSRDPGKQGPETARSRRLIALRPASTASPSDGVPASLLFGIHDFADRATRMPQAVPRGARHFDSD